MTLLLVLNNISSALVVLACWWLAHQNARSKPPGRAIAAGYALLGFSVLLTAIVRSIGITPEWLIVLSKVVLAGTLILMSVRRAKNGNV